MRRLPRSPLRLSLSHRCSDMLYLPVKYEEGIARHPEVTLTLGAINCVACQWSLGTQPLQPQAATIVGQSDQTHLLFAADLVHPENGPALPASHGQGINLEGVVDQLLYLRQPVAGDQRLSLSHRLGLETARLIHSQHALGIIRLVRRLEPAQQLQQAILR